MAAHGCALGVANPGADLVGRLDHRADDGAELGRAVGPDPLRHKRPRRNKAARLRQPKQWVSAINEIQSMDFVADTLFDGRRLRALTVMDNYTRECLAIEVGQSLKRDFSRPGRPIDNAKVESINGRLREDCLNAYWFLSLDDARRKIDAWRRYYNEARPHAALDWMTPSEFARGKAPKLVSEELVRCMRPGSVVVDVAIDQGGCFETSRPTTHDAPTYNVDGVIHYCVTNMPGAVPRTSAYSLNNSTLPYVLALAEKGWKAALRDDPHLRNGLNVHAGKITCSPVAQAHGYEHMDPATLFAT